MEDCLDADALWEATRPGKILYLGPWRAMSRKQATALLRGSLPAPSRLLPPGPAPSAPPPATPAAGAAAIREGE